MTNLDESHFSRRPLTDTPYKKMADTIERLFHRNAMVSLHKVFSKMMPADLAHILETFPPDIMEKLFLQIPDPRLASQVLKDISPSMQVQLVIDIELSKMIPILEQMAPDARTDIISHLEPELANLYLVSLNHQTQKDVQSLMQYPPDTAGGLMTSQFFALSEKTNVAQAIERVRLLTNYEMVFYVYVINDLGRLTGVSSLRQLLLSPPATTMAEMMSRRLIKVRTDTPQEEVAKIASNYRLLAVPVVDDEDILVGLVTVDDVIHVIREEVSDEMLKAVGTSVSEGDVNTSWQVFKIRLPWLLITFLGGFLASGTVVFFEETMTQNWLLVAFLPVILGMTGNFGTVASMVLVRSLTSGTSPSFFSLLIKEALAGAFTGFFYGITAAGMTWLMFKDPFLTSVVAVGIQINMIMAGAVAVSMPMLFLRMGVEPSKASGPVVTMIVDLIGVCLYFLVAWVMQRHLPV